ncbi:MAG: FecR protein [Elusimicrobia bacterium ADurb.Bin231]|nr:MAG: FecR protein [Elusimicrobia bacterium ADurb.Bin231]
MKIIKTFFLALTYMFCLSIYSSADVKVTKVVGRAMVFQNSAWTEAVQEMYLGQNDIVKTEKAGKVELVMDGTSRIWVSENSEMNVGALGDNGFFSLLVGKIRARLKLVSGRKFSVKTPVAIVAVRGTEFIASDKGEVFVLDGLVNMSNIAGTSAIDVGANQYSSPPDAAGTFSQPAEISEEQKAAINQEWSDFDTSSDQGSAPEESDGQKEQKAQDTKKEEIKQELAVLKQELREAISSIKTDIQMTREIANEIKESDFDTARTLRDVHGNLVRIEQHLLRPDKSTLQFINLTKRNSYTYKGKFDYSGPSGSRIDTMDSRITFNKQLPEQLTDWPNFIGDQDEDTFYPQAVNLKITNQKDTLEMIGVSKDKGELDEKGDILEERRIVGDMFVNGWKVDPNYDTGDSARPEYDPLDESIDESGEASDDLWATAISPTIRLEEIQNGIKTGVIKDVKFYVEGYGINNSGSILNLNDFTSAKKNPFDLLKNVAAEGIIACREKTTGTDFFQAGNIDMVVTPDLFVAIAHKLATKLGDIGEDIK